MNWFYSKDGQQLGPVAFSEIERLLAEGQITEESLVWQQGSPNWVKLSTVLSAAAPAPAAPPIPEIAAAPTIPAYTAPAATATTTAVAAPKTSGFAITSLVLSVVGLFCCTLLVFNIGGIVFGHLALNQIKKNPAIGGRGLAIAGLIVGYLGLILGIVAAIYYITAWPEIQETLRQIEEQQRQQNSNP